MDVKSYNTNSPVYKVTELYDFVKRYRLDSALKDLGVVSNKLLFNNDENLRKLGVQTISEWNVAFAAKALILSSNDYRSKLLGDKGLFEIMNRANNLYDPLMDSNDDTGKGYEFLFRIANQQFPFQIGIKTLIPRNIILFSDIPSAIEKPSYDITKKIKEIYGLTVEEILMIGFCILTASGDGLFDTRRLTEAQINGLSRLLTKRKVRMLLEKISTDYNNLRLLYREDEGGQGLEQYSFNALRKYPIVVTQHGKYVVPVARFLLERITSGIFYSLADNSRSEKGNKFLTFFGKEIFEKYIGLLLEQEVKNENLYSEWTYGKSKKHTSDWIIINGEVATLIECKTSGITKEAKSSGDLVKITEDIKRHIVEGIKQMAKLEINARKEVKGLESLSPITSFQYLLVTYDRVYMANTELLRRLVDEELCKLNVKSSYDIVSIKEFEEITPLLKKYGMDDLIRRKHSREETVVMDFDVFLSHILPDEDRGGRNEYLDKRWDSMLEQYSNKFKLPSKVA